MCGSWNGRGTARTRRVRNVRGRSFALRQTIVIALGTRAGPWFVTSEPSLSIQADQGGSGSTIYPKTETHTSARQEPSTDGDRPVNVGDRYYCFWNEGCDVRLAIVQPYKVSHFVSNIPRGTLEYCPMVLERKEGNILQAMDVNVLTALAGRVNHTGFAGRKQIIFETTVDSQRAEMNFA